MTTPFPERWDADLSLGRWLDAVASERPLPAGGRVAAISATFAAALVEKVARIVLRSPSRAALHAAAEEVVAQAASLRPLLLAVGDSDDRAYAAILAARKQHPNSPGAGHAPVREAHMAAARTQVVLAERAADIACLSRRLQDGVGSALRADLRTASAIAIAAVRGALGNVRVDLAELGEDSEALRLKASAEAAMERAAKENR